MTIQILRNLRATKASESGRGLLTLIGEFAGPSTNVPIGTLAANLDLVRNAAGDALGGEVGAGLYDFRAQLGLAPDIAADIAFAIVVVRDIVPGTVPTQAQVLAGDLEAGGQQSVGAGDFAAVNVTDILQLPAPAADRVHFVGVAWVSLTPAVVMTLADGDGTQAIFDGLEL